MTGRWPSLRGYVIIRVTGTGLESWANRVVQSGIPLWDVTRPLPDTLVARVRRSDFPRLRALRGRRVRYRVLDRFGLAVLLGKLWRRRGLVLGAVAFFLAFYILTSLLWFVEVEAPPGLDKQTVRQAAVRAGLYPGQRLARIDPATVERRIHMELPQVAWASLELRGTRALLRVAERPGWSEGRDAPYGHVVADRDGVIVQMVVVRGEPVAAVGDTVTRGQMLVSGLLSSRGEAEARDPGEGEGLYERAEARVLARVWYEEYGEAPLVEVERIPTGRTERRHVLAAGPYRLAFGPARSRFAHYDERREVRWESAGGTLPAVRWETVWRDEVALRRRTRDGAVALAEAVEAARRRIDARRKPGSRTEREDVVVLSRGEGDGRVRVRVLVEAREDIGAFEPIFMGDSAGNGSAVDENHSP